MVIVATSFMPRTTWLEWLDVIFGFVILTDFSFRLYSSAHPLKEFTHPATWADLVALVSFLAPVVNEKDRNRSRHRQAMLDGLVAIAVTQGNVVLRQAGHEYDSVGA